LKYMFHRYRMALNERNDFNQFYMNKEYEFALSPNQKGQYWSEA
jgi:hypothetical protein